jgi:hypothetical protein
MRRSFDGLDKDGGGSLDQAELIEATKACGVDDVEEDDIASMLSKVGTTTPPHDGRRGKVTEQCRGPRSSHLSILSPPPISPPDGDDVARRLLHSSHSPPNIIPSSAPSNHRRVAPPPPPPPPPLSAGTTHAQRSRSRVLMTGFDSLSRMFDSCAIAIVRFDGSTLAVCVCFVL